MKAPDKVWLNKFLIRPGMLYPAQYPANEPEFEYIRKDVLLEWAKEAYLNENASATRKVCFKQLIEKIESL